MKNGRVLVLGGGPAGLSTAAALCDKGFSVRLIERNTSVGGSLCGPRLQDEPPAALIPPLVLGCHHETRRLLTWLGENRSLQFPSSLQFRFALPNGRLAALPRLWGPALIRGPATVAGFTGLPMRDRLSFVNFLERLWEEDLRLPADLDARPATELWQWAKQSEPTIRRIWTPLCRFLIGDEPGAVSAAVLTASLRTVFLGSRRDSALGLVTGSLFETLVHPLETRLRKLGADLQVNHRAMQIVTKGSRVTGLRLEGGTDLSADWYVSALPPEALAALLPERWLAQYASFQELTGWEWSPRVCVKLDSRLEKVKPWLTLLADGLFDWATGSNQKTVKSSIHQIWLVATGHPTLLTWSDDKLIEQAWKDLRPHGPSLTPDRIMGRQVFRTARAFPSLQTGTRRLRAVSQSPISNLFLAGAWTDTDMPVNLESALVSGRRCAEAIARAASGDIDRAKYAH